MTRDRLSYYPTEMLESITWLDSKSISKKNGLSTARSENDLSLVNLMKMLFVLNQKSLNFSVLYYQSGFRFKKGFLKYLDFLQERKMIEKIPSDHLLQFYKITEKGRVFLELLV